MDINYIWLEDYPANLTTAIDGPICMARFMHHSYNINFWCLDEYSDRFRDYFKRNAVNNITVLGIESYVSRINNSLWMYQYEQKWVIDSVEFFINQIADKVKKSNSYLRDIVNVKNLISLFLLYYKGGYILDTSTYPAHLKTQNEIKSSKYPIFPKNSVIGDSSSENSNMIQLLKKCSDLVDKKNTISFNREVFLENFSTSDFMKSVDASNSIFPDLESWYMYSPKHHEISWVYLECFLRCLPGVHENSNHLSQSYHSRQLREYKRTSFCLAH